MYLPLTFSCLIAVTKTLSTILNRSRDYVHFCLFPHFSGKGLNFSLFSMCLSEGFWDMFLVPLVSPRFLILLFKKLIIWISYIMHPDCPQFPVLLCIPLTPAPTRPKTNFSYTHYDLVKLLAVSPPREG